MKKKEGIIVSVQIRLPKDIVDRIDLIATNNPIPVSRHAAVVHVVTAGLRALEK